MSKKSLETIVKNSSPNTKKENKKKKVSKSTKKVIVLTKKEMRNMSMQVNIWP